MRSLERAVDLGCNFFDTAWAYGEGHSERLLGAAGAAIPTGGSTSPPRSRRRTASGRRAGEPLDDVFPPDHIRRYTEKSLRTSAWTRST